jgi:hypothetical protein
MKDYWGKLRDNQKREKRAREKACKNEKTCFKN